MSCQVIEHIILKHLTLGIFGSYARGEENPNMLVSIVKKYERKFKNDLKKFLTLTLKY